MILSYESVSKEDLFDGKKEGRKSHDIIPLRGRFRHEAVFKQWGYTKCDHNRNSC
jgi:hypothetical protein